MQFELSPSLSEILKGDVFIKSLGSKCLFDPVQDSRHLPNQTKPHWIEIKRELVIAVHRHELPDPVVSCLDMISVGQEESVPALELSPRAVKDAATIVIPWLFEHHLRDGANKSSFRINTSKGLSENNIPITFCFTNTCTSVGNVSGTIVYLSISGNGYSNAFLISNDDFRNDSKDQPVYFGTMSTKTLIDRETSPRDVPLANMYATAKPHSEPDQLDDGLPIYLSEWVAQYVLSDLVNTTEINGRSGNTVDLDTKHVALLLDTILTDEDRSELKEHLGFLWATCDRVGQSVKRSLGNDVHVVARGHSMSLEEKVVQGRKVIDRTKRAGLRDYSGVRSSRG